MGLDQYAVAREIGAKKEDDPKELAYWRKHNRLQGYMECLWRKKTGETGEFNCVEVQLTLKNLDDLKAVIEDKKLPKTSGFFYGSDSYEDYDGEYGYKKDDVAFIKAAKKAIKDGLEVYYSSWW